MNLTPVGNRILVEPLQEENATQSGLYIRADTEDAPVRGKVVRTGAGTKTKSGKVLPVSVKEGDTVVYPKGTGQKVKIEQQEYVILVEDQLMAVEE